MSSDIAIKVEGLGKCYQIYDEPQDRLKQSIYPRLQRMLGLPIKGYCRDFWALKDVSFEVKRGETVGIIGRNGSGKSTLLQLICGTLAPTCGSVITNGRVAALLELGSGFNPEFTGRENVYINGAILGLSKEEIDHRFNAIADFADIGDFIEQPVKTYSSGMIMRLAFAVSANIDPDILIIDEALSVGDSAFQVKCIDRLKNLINNETTLLIVSHDINMMKTFCDRVIYLRDGKVMIDGMSEIVTERYFLDIRHEQRKSLCGKSVVQKNVVGRDEGFAFGTDEGQITSISFGADGGHNNCYIRGDYANIRVEVLFSAELTDPCLSIIIQDRRLIDITGRFLYLSGEVNEHGWKKSTLILKFPVQLSPGKYYITARLENRPTTNTFMPIDKQVGALSFDVIENKQEFLGIFDMGIEIIK